MILLPVDYLSAQNTPPKDLLSGMVVVIDPGHGGRDPGAMRWFNQQRTKKRLVEDEYAYDVALRLNKLVKEHGGIPILTVRDPGDPLGQETASNNRFVKDERDETFVRTGRVATSDLLGIGLRTRVKTANEALKNFPKHRVVFISIHFDFNPVPTLQGVHFITSGRGPLPELVKYLEEDFRSVGYLRKFGGKEYRPVGRNGNKRHGLPTLVILRGKHSPYKGSWNHVRQRVLVELGNFANTIDVNRMMDYQFREEYAEIIFESLIRTNQLDISKVRK